MLIRRPTLEGIAAGSITLVFRRWERPRVRPGSRQRTAVGVLEVVSVDAVDLADLTADDARAAGFSDLPALRAEQTGDGCSTGSGCGSPARTRGWSCGATTSSPPPSGPSWPAGWTGWTGRRGTARGRQRCWT